MHQVATTFGEQWENFYLDSAKTSATLPVNAPEEQLLRVIRERSDDPYH